MFYTIYSVHYLSLQLYIGELFLFYNFTLVTYITLHLLWMSEHNLCSSALAAKLTLFFEIIVFYLKKKGSSDIWRDGFFSKTDSYEE